jgi:YesN/AraC family two-component response regulator
MLKISDTGTGIPEDKLNDLFKLERRSIQEGTLGEKGTGLGLLLVKEFVEVNKGSIQVESKVGVGSSFVLTLMRSDVEVPPVEEPDDTILSGLEQTEMEFLNESQLSSMKGLRILIVEDQEAMRQHLHYLLSSTFEIQESANGEEALQLSISFQPTVIISDIEMPGMSGVEFCRIIKQQAETSHIPVIILTTHDDERTRISSYFAGADIYVTKPARKEMLYGIIYNILKGRDLLRKKLAEADDLQQWQAQLTESDAAFLKKVDRYIEENMSDPTLEVQHLVRFLGMSRSVLYAKFKAIFGQGVNEYIRVVRVRRSKELLKSTTMSINEIAYQVGFNSASYFIRCFVKECNCTPGEYREER